MKTKGLTIENVKIGFRNFSGQKDKYNTTGQRSFAIFLDYELAADLSAEGWNVKYPKQRDDIDPAEDKRLPYLHVAFNLETSGQKRSRAPKIVLLYDGVPTVVTEDNIDLCDWVNIDNADIIVRPYHWEVGPNRGIKAYLEALYINVETDAFHYKYGNI